MFGPVLGPFIMFVARGCYTLMVMLNPFILKTARAYQRLSWVKKVFVKFIIIISICYLLTPKNSEVYKYFAALSKYIITSTIWVFNSNITVFDLIGDFFNAYCERRGFHYYNSFAWWALSSTIFFPWLYY